MRHINTALAVGVVALCSAHASVAHAQYCEYVVESASPCGNYTQWNYSTVSGGVANYIGSGTRGPGDAEYCTIAGGAHNTISDAYISGTSTISGGSWNTIVGYNSGTDTIGGGYSNIMYYTDYATIAGGVGNYMDWATYSTIGGGGYNSVENTSATVGGGYGNLASGQNATVPGGASNIAAGTGSFAAGANAYADQAGCFVWSDGTATQHCVFDNSGTLSTGASASNAFVARATGGVVFLTGSSTFVSVKANGNTWLNNSDRNKKHGFEDVDTREALRRLVAMPISTWAYNGEEDARHIGPMAQDFHAAFPLSDDDTHVNNIDEAGAAFAAIQGLYAELHDRDATIRGLTSKTAELEKANAEANQRVVSMEQRLAAIEAQLGIRKQ